MEINSKFSIVFARNIFDNLQFQVLYCSKNGKILAVLTIINNWLTDV